jgi:hypothetical protein
MYVLGGTGSATHNSILAKLHWRRNRVVYPPDEEVRIELVTSSYEISGYALLHVSIHHPHIPLV